MTKLEKVVQLSNTKRCSRCQQILPLDQFNKKASTPTGYNSACRQCANAMKRNMSPKQREIKNAKNRAYRANNPEAVRLTNKIQYANKREERIAYSSAFARNNKDIVNARGKKWRDKNKELMAFYQRQRRAKLKGNPVFKITKKELVKLYKQPCIYCGSTILIEIDHVIPIDLGGTHGISNLAPACRSCNRSKRNMYVMQWKLKRQSR